MVAHILCASAQLRDGGPGHRSDGAKVVSEDLTGARETTLRQGQRRTVLGLKQAVLSCGDKSAAPGLPRTPLPCPWLTAWRLTGWGRSGTAWRGQRLARLPTDERLRPSTPPGPRQCPSLPPRQVRASEAGRHPHRSMAFQTGSPWSGNHPQNVSDSSPRPLRQAEWPGVQPGAPHKPGMFLKTVLYFKYLYYPPL